MKRSTSIEEQIARLEERGMLLDIGYEKTKEILNDIGYFRLGFYCFPFEKSYPNRDNRTHEYKSGTKISDVVALYYFDVCLRQIIVKHVNRIEINLRTKVIYEVSNFYKDSPTWFADPLIMSRLYVDEFDSKVYNKTFVKNKVISLHHKKYINDKYAPVWKTLEYIPFGGILKILKNIKDPQMPTQIAKAYGIENLKVFERYIGSIVEIRNVCAHGGVLFDFTLGLSLSKGPAMKIENSNKNILNSVIEIIIYILRKVSINRAEDMRKEIDELFAKYASNEKLKQVLKISTGYKFN